MPEPDADPILEHYRRQAEEHKLAPSSTMLDDTTRQLEVEAVLACVRHAVGRAEAHLLEVGCGNGYLLATLRDQFPALRLIGVDFSPEMVALAASRQLPGCEVDRADVRSLPLPTAGYDVVVSERCVINLMDEGDQYQALGELHRVLRPGGHLVMIEAFTDGLENLNRARAELGLDQNAPPHHNRWMDKERVLAETAGRFEPVVGDGLPPANFLSSHYFVSRVLYPAVTRREVLYNTEFVRFFRFVEPRGEYSPIQLLFLRKLEG